MCEQGRETTLVSELISKRPLLSKTKMSDFLCLCVDLKEDFCGYNAADEVVKKLCGINSGMSVVNVLN